MRSIEDGGVRVDFGGTWALARPSGTEPLLGGYAESGDAAESEAMAERLAGAVRRE